MDNLHRPRFAFKSVVDSSASFSSTVEAREGFGPRNIALWSAWTTWFLNSETPTEVELSIVFPSSRAVQSFAFYGHNALGVIAVDVLIGATYVEVATTTVAERNGKVIYLIAPMVYNTTSIRLRFASINYLTVFYAGVDLVTPVGCEVGWQDPSLGQRAVVSHEVSRRGVWLGASAERWISEHELKLRYMDPEWVYDYWVEFVEVCSTQPFFLHWNAQDWPQSAIFCYDTLFGRTPYHTTLDVEINMLFTGDFGAIAHFDPPPHIEPEPSSTEGMFLQTGSLALVGTSINDTVVLQTEE